jgi:hypothetical protein
MSGLVNTRGTWTPFGLSFAAGMALHSIESGPLHRWASADPQQAEDEARYPDNLFISNAREADRLARLHWMALSAPCHDRP